MPTSVNHVSKSSLKCSFRHHYYSTNGFTLIELLVVVLVISALSGILLGIVNSSGVRAKARDAQRKTDLKKIQVALQLYHTDYRQYPDSSNGTGQWAHFNSSPAVALLENGYIKPVPVDPSKDGSTNSDPCSADTSHRYNYRSDGSYYYLSAMMEVETSKSDSPCPSDLLFCNGVPATSKYCYYVQSP